jgi:hypothetical protein
MASEAGRDPATIAMSFRIDVALGEVASDPRHPTSHSVTRPDALVETLTAYGDAGMEHVVIAFSSGDLDELTMGVRVIANDVAPHLR